MTILNLLLDNNDIIFYALISGVTGVIGWSWYASSMKSNVSDTVNTISKETMTSPVTDTAWTPPTFSVSYDQLGQWQDILEKGIQTESPLKRSFTPISEKGVQAISEVANIGTPVKPALTVDIVNLIPSLDTSFILRSVDLSEISNSYTSVTSNLVQAVPEYKDIVVQTLFSSLDRGFQAMINPELRVSADLVEFGTANIQTSPITKELADSAVQTLVQVLDKGVQTKPDMKIDSSSAVLEKAEIFPFMESNIDLDLIEAMTPISGTIVDVATTVANYYPMYMG